MKLIDAHCHLNDKRFRQDFSSLVNEIEKELEFVVNVGYNLNSSQISVDYANKYDFFYAAVGIHPNDADTYNALVDIQLEELLEHPKAVAIGEIGLDYYRDYVDRTTQKLVFRKQLELAKRVHKPIMIHCRDAYEDTLSILNEYKEIQGVFHSYAGNYEMAAALMDRFYFSISGPVTFQNAKALKETVTKIPLDRILVETDCPYLTPVPYRGQRNQPIYVTYIAKEIAKLKGVSFEEVVKRTNENTKKAFHLIK